MMGIQLNAGIGLFDLLDRIRSNNGLLALVLTVMAWFSFYLFYRVVRYLLHATVNGKDQEIARLTQELDKYQSIVFERLLPPDDLVILTHKGWPEDEGGGGNSSQDKVH